MFTLEINSKTAKVINWELDGYNWTISTSLILGIVYDNADKHFADQIANAEINEVYGNNIIKSFASKGIIKIKNANKFSDYDYDKYFLFGQEEYGALLMNLYPLFNDKALVYPTLDMVESLRIDNLYALSPLPVDRCDLSKGLQYKNLQSVLHIAIAILHYYALNNYRLKKCAFCGKWFATIETSAQSQFCSNNYKYTDCNGNEHKYSSHIEAKKRILDRCGQRFRRIEKMLYSRYGQIGDRYNEFYNTAADMREKAKKQPTIENLLAYESYLYIECEKYYKRYSR